MHRKKPVAYEWYFSLTPFTTEKMFMFKFIKSKAGLLPMVAVVTALVNANACLATPNDDPIPNLVGNWSGENKTYSEKKGYASWIKTIEITEQNGRIFKGHFTYMDGTKQFFGVIYPDNTSFTWVSSDSKGYNQGRILGTNKLSACYTEAGADATVGCAELSKSGK
ncbi:MAG: hypothetical protein M0R33_20385 [Methylomonas sp.]|uniref:hypothetical protein n=1 Tax=Methylomonas sp. TaxID=418 RepID=UPI0025FDB000|nr:hypothetical protein [Methylomonas sp.]MCK9608804.1 hypothetical protein [Methylomonas sp.]